MLKHEKIVVSLTSFPGAICYAIEAIRSILQGSLLPDKLVLYLTFSQFKEVSIPTELTQMQQDYDCFEIRDYPQDIRSYRKLIPALRDFPDETIVTIDDDVRYDREMLADIIKVHRSYPNAVIANRAKVINLDKPYKKWKKLRWYNFIAKRIKISPLIIQTGVGGVLYPPHSLNPEMLKECLFTEIAPTTDDLWFWAAAITNGRTVIPVPFGPHNKPKELGKPKELSLKSVNFKSGANRNDVSFKAILEKYPEIEKFLN